MLSINLIILVAAIAAAAPTGSSTPNDLGKRIAKTSNCGLDFHARGTEERLAEIIEDLTSDCGYSDNTCSTTTIVGNPGGDGKIIACRGGTGVALNIDPVDVPTVSFNAGDIGKQLQETYKDCVGDDPGNAGDDGYFHAYQFWGKGYNLVVHGSMDCKGLGF